MVCSTVAARVKVPPAGKVAGALREGQPPLIYCANPVRGARQFMSLGRDLAMIATPKQGNKLPPGAWWIADNGRGPGRDGVITGGCGKGWPGEEKWLAWLGSYSDADKERCLFATAPDVVGDAAATMALSRPYFARLREMGYAVALVLQNGQEDVPVPWHEIDAVFVGGDDEFKLGEYAARLCAEARRRGKWVHVGRVNSFKRFAYSARIGADSADGTYLTYGAKRAPEPNVNLPKVLGWLKQVNGGPSVREQFALAA